MGNDSSALAHAEQKPSAAAWLLRRAYTSNPFYVISADLVFVGLRMSLDASGQTSQTGALMLALMGYTLLLATTACLLIRMGDVWDDVRTLLLLVVAMFLAISVTFDETLAGNPRLGRLLYLGGLLFAVAVSEGVLRGIRLRLPALFRAPYYLILSLFFLYPVALTPWLGDPDSPALQWALFGFSPLAGVAFLCLLPAVRRGPGYVAGNGSPWRYPLYPWVLFGLLGAAVCGRAIYLCLSFHFVGKSDSIFGPYFLVPFLFAADLLLLEAGVVSRNRTTQRVALVALPALLMLSAAGHRPDPVYQRFLTTFQSGLGGSPLFLTLIAVLAAYGLAAARRLPLALAGMTLSLFALCVVGPRTLDLGGLVAPQPLPLVAVAALQLGLALRHEESWRALLGSVCLIGAVTIGAGRFGLHEHQGLIAFHAVVVALMAIGVVFDDPLARVLQGAGAALLVLSGLTAVGLGPVAIAGPPPEVVRAYPFLLCVAAAGYGYLTGCRPYLAAASVGLLGWLTAIGWQGYCGLRWVLPGLDWITGGLAFFGLAAIISLGKAGVWSSRGAQRRNEGIGGSLTGADSAPGRHAAGVIREPPSLVAARNPTCRRTFPKDGRGISHSR